ncbi:MAG TPA: hypothetical protein VMV86_02895 [Methanosarcinales archaeon]|nr:hypothetical protein [Methanosarcinales archaeon]
MYATINLYDKDNNLIFTSYCGMSGTANVMLEDVIYAGKYVGFSFNLYSSPELDELLVPDKLKPINLDRPLRKLDGDINETKLDK